MEALKPNDDKLKEKYTNHLSRYQDPVSVIRAGFDAQDRIRRGEVSNGLPENPTDEQLSAYREANGIPADPDKYSVSEGTVLGDVDKAVVDTLRPVAFKHNIPQAAFAESIDTLLAAQQVQHDARLAQDVEDTNEASAILKQAWQGEFTQKQNLISGQLNRRLGDEDREALLNARGPDGKGLFNRPGIVQFMATVFAEAAPLDTVVPTEINQVGAIDQELAELKQRMRTNEWYKDEAAQARYRQLIEAKQAYENQQG